MVVNMHDLNHLSNNMFSQKVIQATSKSSMIRAMFEEGEKLRKIHGEDKVYDFSIGNPDPEPPQTSKEVLKRLIMEEKPRMHGYMPNAGYNFKESIMDNKDRCEWCLKDQLYMNYHDNDWGVPLHDDRKLFEMLNLEGAQAGLSWYTVLSKRENYRKVFDNWDAEKVAQYGEDKVMELLQNSGIIRNRLKIQAAISNARAFLKVSEEFGSFDAYIWRFVEGKPIVNHWENLKDLPAKTSLSDLVSKDLQKRGFRFVGSTICYSFMQAVGIVDDHMEYCWKRNI